MNVTNIRDFLRGKKAYITALIGLAGAIIAWSDGQIDNVALLAALWASLQIVFVRAGMDNAMKKAQENNP